MHFRPIIVEYLRLSHSPDGKHSGILNLTPGGISARQLSIGDRHFAASGTPPLPPPLPAPCAMLFSKLLVDCAGHYGHIKLELPVFHIGYFKHTLTMLQVHFLWYNFSSAFAGGGRWVYLFHTIVGKGLKCDSIAYNCNTNRAVETW